MIAVLEYRYSDYHTNKLPKFRRGPQKLREPGIGLSIAWKIFSQRPWFRP